MTERRCAMQGSCTCLAARRQTYRVDAGLSSLLAIGPVPLDYRIASGALRFGGGK